MVKRVWTYAMHVLHNFFRFVINTTAYHLCRYSLHLLLLKRSMVEVINNCYIIQQSITVGHSPASGCTAVKRLNYRSVSTHAVRFTFSPQIFSHSKNFFNICYLCVYLFLPMYLTTQVSTYLGINLPRFQPTQVSTYPGINLPRYHPTQVSTYLGINLPRYLPTYLLPTHLLLT